MAICFVVFNSVLGKKRTINVASKNKHNANQVLQR